MHTLEMTSNLFYFGLGFPCHDHAQPQISAETCQNIIHEFSCSYREGGIRKKPKADQLSHSRMRRAYLHSGLDSGLIMQHYSKESLTVPRGSLE